MCSSVIAAFVIMTMSVAVVMVRDDGSSIGAPASSDIVLEAGSRTVTYEWYDFFDVPFGEWWYSRALCYGTDVPLTDAYPYICRHNYNETMFDTFSNARLNITGRNMAELNMNERPEFLPLFGDARGGTAKIDWFMQYLTEEELQFYPMYSVEWNDGFIISLNGTVTLDGTAAMAVMGITNEELDDFDAWWAANQVSFVFEYIDWMMYEANERLDIFPMYEYPLSPLTFDIVAEKVGDEIVLTYDTVTWGMEALMTRWLHEAFMPTEWWFEDMTFQAEIGPESADLDVDTAVAYAISAWATKDTEEPCWIWEGMLQDSVQSMLPHPYSEFDLYEPLQHFTYSPGCMFYGALVDYRYVPGSFNLSLGETLVFEWPEADILFLEHVSFNVTNNITASARVVYSEPMPSEMYGSVWIDPDNNMLVFEGPIDFWTWSRDQELHENLSAEWDRLGVLPWGMPYFEISMGLANSPPFAHLTAELYPDAGTSAVYLLNASLSSDADDLAEELQFRWDLDGDGTWDIDWGYEAWVVHDFGQVGEYTVVVEVMDTGGASDTCRATVSILDVEPPVTTASIKGIGGANGWYVSDVLLNLTSDDESGVESTTYRLDGESWVMYLDEVEVTAEGSHVVEYCSVDCEGNCEDVCETGFKLDKTAPAAHIVTDATVHITSNVTIVWSRSDPVSGVNRSELSLDGQRYISFGSAMSNTFVGMTDGSHTIELRVYDNAGNYVSDAYSFTVTLSADHDDPPATTDDGDSRILYAAIAICAAVAVAVATLMVMRRKR